MWSDDEIDGAFRRLAPPEPPAEPFPLDAWLRLETKLDKELMEQQFRLRLWKFFAGEMAVVALLLGAWLLWPARQPDRPLAGLPDAAVLPGSKDGQKMVLAAASQADGQAAPSARMAATAPAVTNTYSSLTAPPGTVAGQAAAATTRPAGAGQSAMPRRVSDELPALTLAQTNARAAKAKGELREMDFGRSTRPGSLSPLAAKAPSKKHYQRVGDASGPKAYPLLAAARRHRVSSLSAKASGKPGALAAAGTEANTRPALRASLAGTASDFDHASQRPANGQAARTAARTRTSAKSAAPAVTAAVAVPKAGATGFSYSTASLSKSRLAARQPVAAEMATDAQLAEAKPSLTADFAPLDGRPSLLQVAPLAALPASLSGGAAPVPVPEPAPEPGRKPRFYLGLVGAPDVSTVKMADFQRPKANVGVLVEMRLLDRLRLSTGLLRGTKVYRARQADYDWSYYPLATTYQFEWVEASCTILDLPLNLRYDLLARPRYQLFGSAGLSTLFMQREAYAFDYTYYNRPYHWQRQYVNENQHWLSVLNLSCGYERQLGRHWSAQAEPYLKLPLGGVGAGKVRLASGGVFFGLKYGF